MKFASDLAALVDRLEMESACSVDISISVAEQLHELRERAEQLLEPVS